MNHFLFFFLHSTCSPCLHSRVHQSVSCVKKLEHPWASQHAGYVESSDPKSPIRKKAVSPIEHKDKVSRRKSFDPPKDHSPPPISRKKHIKPPSPKQQPAVRRKSTQFSRRHLEESDPVPRPVKKKPVVPPYALHTEAPISRKKSVPKPVPKENTFVVGKRAIKPAWNVTTLELV